VRASFNFSACYSFPQFPLFLFTFIFSITSCLTLNLLTHAQPSRRLSIRLASNLGKPTKHAQIVLRLSQKLMALAMVGTWTTGSKFTTRYLLFLLCMVLASLVANHVTFRLIFFCMYLFCCFIPPPPPSLPNSCIDHHVSDPSSPPHFLFFCYYIITHVIFCCTASLTLLINTLCIHISLPPFSDLNNTGRCQGFQDCEITSHASLRTNCKLWILDLHNLLSSAFPHLTLPLLFDTTWSPFGWMPMVNSDFFMLSIFRHNTKQKTKNYIQI
jgi:hypothetical protein